jgi:hypothetical protein
MFAFLTKLWGYVPPSDPLRRAAKKKREPEFFLTQSRSEYRTRRDELVAAAVASRDQAVMRAVELEKASKALRRQRGDRGRDQGKDQSKVGRAVENPLAKKAKALLNQSEADAKQEQAQKFRSQVDDSVRLLLKKLEKAAEDVSQSERERIAGEKMIYSSNTTEIESNARPRYDHRPIWTKTIKIERRIVQMEDGRVFLVVLRGDASSRQPLRVDSISDSLDAFSEPELRAIAGET